ncbi:DoxX-like family protein [Glaciecola sp. MH2013]|uniref:DoxX-like family protein n=1 Tax=Glaciecola sp. MH2013 TaxID=2785524 RepID=UPI00189E89A6|nr:DoxX-like family protein [Glaciecola sp. MH2013]MBF7073407.1 DoxX-like family protein [Glaciecola sp. MH2013]
MTQKNKLAHISTVSRLLLGFLFIYHGLVPKILWLSEVEIHLVEISGAGIPASIASPLAGVAEILLGFSIILWRQSLIPIYVAAGLLVALLLYVCIASPSYLIEAFNPVTTNMLGLGFCYLILNTQEKRQSD